VALSLPGLRIRLRSNLGGTTVTGQADEGPPGPLVALLQPEVVVYSGSQEVTRWAPAGSPSELAERVAPVVVVAVVLGVVALAIYGAVQLAR
jgi:hypothetical protein